MFYSTETIKKAYTIGRTTSYDLGLCEPTGIMKCGRSEEYEGGYVAKTFEEADLFRRERLSTFVPDWIPEEFSVYELELPTSWEADVSKTVSEDGIYRLINDSKIVKKITRELC